MLAPAYVLGFGATGLSAVRSLARRGVPVFGATWDGADPAWWSRYCRPSLCPSPVTDGPGLVDFLVKDGARFGERPVLVTATDSGTLLVAQNADRLKTVFRFHLIPPALTTLLIDKRLQYAEAQRGGLPLPRTWYPSSRQGLDQVLPEVTFPAFLKPALGHEWRPIFPNKGFLVTNRAELEQKFDLARSRGLDVVLQEVIEGPAESLVSICCYLGEGGAPLAVFAQRKIRQHPPDFGIGTLVEACEPDETASMVVGFLQSLHYRGPAEVEFKRDSRDGHLKLIEVNARIWEQTALAMACGFDFPWLYYQDVLQQSPPPMSGACVGKWVAGYDDLHASLASARRDGMGWRQWIASYRGVRSHGLFSWDDPGPCLRYYGRLVTGMARSAARRTAGTERP